MPGAAFVASGDPGRYAALARAAGRRGRHAQPDLTAQVEYATAPRWFAAADGRQHAVGSYLDPGHGDVVRPLCGASVVVARALGVLAALTARLGFTAVRSVSRCRGCADQVGALPAAAGSRYGERAHHRSPA